MVTNNMNQIYISIHSNHQQANVSETSWRVLVQSTKPTKLFHYAPKPEATIFSQRDGEISAHRFSNDDQATQILKVLIGESRLNDISSSVQSALTPLPGDVTIQQMIQQLQQTGIIRKFDLPIFTTIVEDRLRLVLRESRSEGPEQMNYLSYCKCPANARSPAGSSEGSDYFLSAYEEPAKKTKKGFWLSYPQGQYRSVQSRDPYSGLM
jgi:hypothetical protein